MQPNLFKYATSELSQDAFICWLLSWCDPQNDAANPTLSTVARDLLSIMFEKHGKVLPEPIEKMEVSKQHNNIDVYVEINDRFAVIIEDKVHTKSHSGQLTKYVEKIKQSDHIKEENIIPIYFKTGDQGRYNQERKKEYKVLHRTDFLELLKKGKEQGITNDIYLDYLTYLQDIENAIKSFRSKPIDEWDYFQWIGFFKYLQKELDPEQKKNSNWDNVSNPRGGFMGFWWFFRSDDECSQYLQIEENKLCFKIEVPENEKRKDLKWRWHHTFMEVGKELDIPVVKPSRLANGRWMTVAIYGSTNENSWISENEDGIDLEQTIQTLRQAERVLDLATTSD